MWRCTNDSSYVRVYWPRELGECFEFKITSLAESCWRMSWHLSRSYSHSESAKFERAPLSWAVVRISCSYLNTSSVNWFICQRRMFNLKKSMRMCPNLSQEVQVARVDRLSKCKGASSLPLKVESSCSHLGPWCEWCTKCLAVPRAFRWPTHPSGALTSLLHPRELPAPLEYSCSSRGY